MIVIYTYTGMIIMETNNMGKITISLSRDAEDKLRKRAEKNLRSISKEVEYLVINSDQIDN